MSDLGGWFSGFVDGEACFYLMQNPRKAALVIALRDDNIIALEKIQRFLGCGIIYRHPARRETEGASASWRVIRLRDHTRKVIPVLDRCELQGAKKKDYEIWKKAIMVLCEVRNGHKHGQNGYSWTETQRQEFDRLKNSLQEVRRYRPSANGDMSTAEVREHCETVAVDNCLFST